MRNYSEIGCLTLLGVTLTVYVAAGNCQPDQMPCDRPSKNINAEEVEKAIKQGSGKHYFVKISTQNPSQKGTQNTIAGFPSLRLAGISDVSADTVFPASFTLVSLPDFSSHKIDDNFPGISLKYCEVFDYKNPSGLLHLEIRAGPGQA